MDLISRRAAIKAIDDLPNCYNGYSDTYDKAYIIGTLEELPSVDAVEVVRCKDCKHRPAFRNDDDDDGYAEGPKYQETLKNGLTVTFEDGTCPCVNEWDSYFSYVPKDDWFCANGERRTEE